MEAVWLQLRKEQESVSAEESNYEFFKEQT